MKWLSGFAAWLLATLALQAQVDPVKLHFELLGWVYDKDTGMPLEGAKVSVIGTNGSYFSAYTNEQGGFAFIENGTERYIKENTSYAILAEKEGCLVVKDQLTTVGLTESTTFVEEYFLQRHIIACPRVPDVWFERNTCELAPGSDSTLFIWLEILRENPSLVVEIRGNVDAREKKSLGLARSRRIRDRLIASGIERTRLIANSNGADQPVIPTTSIEKMKDPAEVEAAHAANRRAWINALRTDWHP